MKTAIYPGSFDPVTYGHLDIIKRAAEIFDELTVSVLNNKQKTPLFSVEERVNILKEATKDIPNIKVESFSGLLVDYAKSRNVHVVIRGLRAITDFEYELQNAQTNALLSKGALDTVFLTTKLEYAYLSSSSVKEIASFKGDISMCVPEFVAKMVYDKYFDSKYLEVDRKKQEIETDITAAFKKDDLVAVDKLCSELEAISGIR